MDVEHLVRYAIEPPFRDLRLPDAAPQLAHEIGENSALISLHAIIRFERSLEHPGGLSAEESLGLRVSFIDAAPRGAQHEIGDATRLGTLPQRYLRREFVFLGARQRAFAQPGRELVPHVLLEHRAHICFLTEISFTAGVATPQAQMY